MGTSRAFYDTSTAKWLCDVTTLAKKTALRGTAAASMESQIKSNSSAELRSNSGTNSSAQLRASSSGHWCGGCCIHSGCTTGHVVWDKVDYSWICSDYRYPGFGESCDNCQTLTGCTTSKGAWKFGGWYCEV